MRFVQWITDFARRRPGATAVIAGLLAIVLGLGTVELVRDRTEAAPDAREIVYSEFAALMREEKIAEATVGSSVIRATTRAGERVSLDHDGWLYKSDILDQLAKSGAKVAFPGKPAWTLWGILAGIMAVSIPILFFIAIGGFVWMMWMQARHSFSPSWPDIVNGHTVRFKDVAGQDEAKFELEEIKTFLADPTEYARLGARPPRGVLMAGPPGTGKTLLAKALAGEVGANFIAVSGSDFSSMWVGVGRGKIEKLFKVARKKAPCIVFIDEIDAVARQRGASSSDVSRESDTTLNQLLVEMDGFKPDQGVIVIGATNLIDLLDPALLRPGRFDRKVFITLPDLNGRKAILSVHAGGRPIAAGVDLHVVAQGTPGYSGADLQNLVNEASVLAAREGASEINADHFENARDKILMGLQRRGMALDDEERKLIAVHEAGHAVVATLSPASDKVHAATIVPRGPSLGLVLRLPERDRVAVSRERLDADLAVAMAGRAAEEIVLGASRVTTGAAADIEFATVVARNMVMKWGMSAKVGMVKVDGGPGVAPDALVEQEVRRIVEEAYVGAKKLLEEHRAALDAVAQSLLNQETLSGHQVRALVEGSRLRPVRTRRLSKPKPTAADAAA